jgi:shikimate kinase
MTTERNAGRGLALVGARGSGKTTVGQRVAARLRRAFIDLDTEIEAKIDMPIADFFATSGERLFRDQEASALAACTEVMSPRPGSDRGIVLATGGGVVLRAENRRRLRAFGFVVWLTAEPEILAARLEADPRGLLSRPALTAAGTLAELAGVLHARAPLYREVADVVIDTTGRTPDDVAEAVLSAWHADAELERRAP